MKFSVSVTFWGDGMGQEQGQTHGRTDIWTGRLFPGNIILDGVLEKGMLCCFSLQPIKNGSRRIIYIQDRIGSKWIMN